MAQFGRPSADTLRDNWEEDDGTTTAIYDQIDETPSDDADYIRTVLVPTNDVYVTKLSALTDPLQSTGHILRYRYKKDAAAGAQINLTVELRQGYVNEGSKGTLITSATHNNISDTITAGSITLSGGEADSITDYTDLYVRFVGNQV